MNSFWLFGKKLDILALYLPVWFCWCIAFLLPERALHSELPLWVWVCVVVGIDVSHVWSSIYRTYLDREEFSLHRRLLVVAPILSFVLSYGLAVISMDLFWRCLAYVAVYHFVKQQFGFMRIYKARSRDFRSKRLKDNFVIYLSMLYPIFYWHLSADREFAWFVQGDFITIPVSSSFVDLTLSVGNVLYISILGIWLLEEIWFTRRSGMALPIGKILWVGTTAGNWFLGIVYFNSDIVFTVTNVVAHGVPYLALIIFYKTKKEQIKSESSQQSYWKWSFIVVASVLFLAFAEEYLWDLMVYRENEELFSTILPYNTEAPSMYIQLLFVGALAVPQVTHYILDGFIWKKSEKNPYVKKILLK